MPELRPALFFLLTPLDKFLVGYYLGRKLGQEYSKTFSGNQDNNEEWVSRNRW